jgi:hypothetical protein
MDDPSGEIDDLRLDTKTLRSLIDFGIDRDARGDDLLLRASTNVLDERRTRLEELERMRSLVDQTHA